jgi:hypothetical protein
MSMATVAVTVVAPFSATELGVITQVEFGGAPAQLRATFPAMPPSDATEIVKTAVCPEGIVSEAGEADIVKSCTLSVNACVELGETPLLATIVMLYTPPVPAAGAPPSTPVVGLSVTPDGSAPVSLKVGAG